MKAIHNLNHRIRARQRGSILVICMVLAGVGAIGAAAFFALIQAKTEETEQAKTNVERRARQANSVALAKEILYRKYVDAETGPAAAETHTLPDGWGEVTISPFTEKPLDTTAATRMNKTGAVPAVSYTADVSVAASDGDVVHPWQVQIKSASPSDLRDLVVFQEPTLALDDHIEVKKIRVKGRAQFWVADDKDVINLTAYRVFSIDPAVPKKLDLFDFAGNPLKPDNFPFMNSTTGRLEGASKPSYDGRISIVDNADPLVESYAEIVEAQGTPTELNGLVEYPKFTTDPVVIYMDDGSAITGSGGTDDDDDAADDDVVAGGYSQDVYSLVRQFLRARIRLSMAYRAAVDNIVNVKFSYEDVEMGVPALSDWFTYEHEFKGDDALQAWWDLQDSIWQLNTDMAAAMTALGGPDPWTGPWWPKTAGFGGILPKQSDPYWVDKNPYPDGVWQNAPAGSSGDGEIRIDITKATSDIRILDNAEILTIEGQPDEASANAAALLDPLLIVVTSSSDPEFTLEKIELQGINRRELILAMKMGYEQSTEPGFPDVHKKIEVKFDGDTTPDFPEWRIVMELENSPLEVKLGGVGGGATFLGGIRTDASLKGDEGELTIEADPDVSNSAGLIKKRYAWLEAFRN